ncbi:hypothetical protein KFE25_011615 [Diacronema lutheri]|uniref:Uncharacterized protein n=2 Tax=Diacronema lutheri TaxID=2081491 RepID=A0A8J5XFV6_DIALT|nr:hypothetical protein KFE25_011615 [Diacronema lutheri]
MMLARALGGRRLALAAAGAACGAACAAGGAVWGERAHAAAAPPPPPQRLFVWGQAAVPRAGLPQRPLDVRTLRDAGAAEVRAVAFGGSFVAASDANGELWLWPGAEGSVRDGAPGPWRVRLGERVASLAATDDAIVAVTARGRALLLERVGEWCEAIDAPTGARIAPAAPPRALAGDASRRRVASAAAGAAHILLVCEDGSLLALGANERGQLGLGDAPAGVAIAAAAAAAPPPLVEHPRLVGGALAGATVVSAACGASHSLAVTADGRLFAFGDDRWLQLGLRDGGVPSIRRGPEMRAEPVEVSALGALRAAGHVSDAAREPERWRVACAAAGGAHSLIALRDARSGATRLLACGNGRWGQLGDGQFRHISAPREVKGVRGLEEWDEAARARVPITVRALAAGAEHSAALLSSGDVLVWGANALSQQGTGGRVGNAAPSRLCMLTGVPMGGLTCARNSCAAWTACAPR